MRRPFRPLRNSRPRINVSKITNKAEREINFKLLEMSEDPNGKRQGDDGDGVAREVDGGGYLADVDGRLGLGHLKWDTGTVVAPVGPNPRRQADSGRIFCSKNGTAKFNPAHDKREEQKVWRTRRRTSWRVWGG